MQEFVITPGTSYGDAGKGLHPWDGVTEPNYELGANTKGTQTDIEELDESGEVLAGSRRRAGTGTRWRWVRWRATSSAMPPGKPEFKEPVDRLLKKLDLPLTALFSTLGRTAARGLEGAMGGAKTALLRQADAANIKNGDTATANVEKWDPDDLAEGSQGRGHCRSAARRAGHWIKIKDGKIENYQCVVPTTWNGSPRDTAGNIGAFEAALMSTPMVDPEQAAGNPAHHSQLRPLPGLLDPRDEPDGQEIGRGEGALSRRGRRTNPPTSGEAACRRRFYRSTRVPVRIWHWVTALVHPGAGDHRLPDRLAAAVDAGRGDRPLPDGLHPLRALRRRLRAGDRASVLRHLLGVRRQQPRARDLHRCRCVLNAGLAGRNVRAMLHGTTCSSSRPARPWQGHNPLAMAAMFFDVRARHGVHDRAPASRSTVRAGHGSWAVHDRSPSWVIPLVGYSQNVHTLHHLGMWYVLIFAIAHLYMRRARGHHAADETVLSTMVNGWRVAKK